MASREVVVVDADVLIPILSCDFLLTGLDRTDDKVFCKVVAGLLHFLFLSAFTWMLLEGVQIYMLLVKVSFVLFYFILLSGLNAFNLLSIVNMTIDVRSSKFQT